MTDLRPALLYPTERTNDRIAARHKGLMHASPANDCAYDAPDLYFLRLNAALRAQMRDDDLAIARERAFAADPEEC